MRPSQNWSALFSLNETDFISQISNEYLTNERKTFQNNFHVKAAAITDLLRGKTVLNYNKPIWAGAHPDDQSFVIFFLFIVFRSAYRNCGKFRGEIFSERVFSRRILSKWARLLQWQVFFLFFRQTTECMRSGHFFYRTTKLLDRQAETHLS